MGDLTENTKIIITIKNIAKIAGIIISVIIAIFVLASWKSDLEFKVDDTLDRIIECETNYKTLNNNVIEIKTDVKWLIENAKGE
jgi:hypothetical protein